MFFDTILGRNFGRVYLSKVIIVCHGFPYEPGSVIDKGYGELAEFFSKIAPTLIFDFSGCGKSFGIFGIKNWIGDVKKIAEKFEKVSLLGYSLGGLIAIEAGKELKNLEKLVAISTPIPEIFNEERIKLMFENAVKIMRLGSFERFREEMRIASELNPKRSIKKIMVPKLIVHGTKDEVVPFECGEEIYESAEEPKAFLKVIGGNHFLRKELKVMQLVSEWLEGKVTDKEIEIKL